MALSAEAKWANVEGSLRQYINTNLAASFSSGAAIDFGSGEPFDDTAYSEWLQVRLLDAARPRRFEGRASSTQFGRELWYILNVNVFIRPAKLATANSLRLQTLRDTVVAWFTLGTKIAVVDYAGDNSALGNMFCDGVHADRLIPPADRENELLQWNLVIPVRWSETWT